MIEVTVKKGDRVVMALPIDEHWKNELLSKFVSQLVDSIFELPISAVRTKEVPEQPAEETLPPTPSQPNAPMPTQLILNDKFKVTDSDAKGRKQVLKYQGNRVTGNMFATLKALCDKGGYVDIADDLADPLKVDQRFDLDLKSDTIRAQLRSLVKLGLVDEASQSGRRITHAGEYLANLLPIIPIPKQNIEWQ